MYSRGEYKQKEPISLMSKTMDKVLTDDVAQLILQNQLLSPMFRTLVSKLNVLKENDERSFA